MGWANCFSKIDSRNGPETPLIQVKIGLDHCSDRTEEIAQQWAALALPTLGMSENIGPQGKWQIILKLVLESRADWVALIDAGSVWQPGLLGAISEEMQNPEIIGIAPSYGAAQAKLLDRLSWRLERFLKNLENKAGGPVSVHGATVFYRRKFLVKVLRELTFTSKTSWLNDDVVIPLSLRTRWPQFKIVYVPSDNSSAWVMDQGTVDQKNNPNDFEFRRRRRMVLGNIQWIRTLYLKAILLTPKIGLLATRRVFRVFWAYWLLMIAAGLSLRFYLTFEHASFMALLPIATFLILAWIPLQGQLLRLRSTFYAGLTIPFIWNTTEYRSEKIWN